MNSSTRGFTPLQILFAVAAAALAVAMLSLLIVRLYDTDDNAATLRQAFTYITVLENNYHKQYDRYPAPIDEAGEALTDLGQYGCLSPTFALAQCLFDGREVPLFPDKLGLEQLNIIEPLLPLEQPIADRRGDEFDAITYSSNGSKFRLRYPLAGDSVNCGIRNAYEIFADSPNFEGVTICVYESR